MFYLTSLVMAFKPLSQHLTGGFVSGLSQRHGLDGETNLALALENQANGAVKSVDFATVWGQANTTVERTACVG